MLNNNNNKSLYWHYTKILIIYILSMFETLKRKTDIVVGKLILTRIPDRESIVLVWMENQIYIVVGKLVSNRNRLQSISLGTGLEIKIESSKVGL